MLHAEMKPQSLATVPPYHNTSTAQTSMLHPIEQNIHVPVLRISKVMYIVCQVSLRITLSVCVPHLQRDKHDAAKCDVWPVDVGSRRRT
jgi:hypothetical protein